MTAWILGIGIPLATALIITDNRKRGNTMEVTTEQNRFKSPLFWAAVATNVITIGQLSGLWQKIGIADVSLLTEVTMLVINTVATILGLANNPTSKTSF